MKIIAKERVATSIVRHVEHTTALCIVVGTLVSADAHTSCFVVCVKEIVSRKGVSLKTPLVYSLWRSAPLKGTNSSVLERLGAPGRPSTFFPLSLFCVSQEKTILGMSEYFNTSSFSLLYYVCECLLGQIRRQRRRRLCLDMWTIGTELHSRPI